MNHSPLVPLTRVVVDLTALSHNIKTIKSRCDRTVIFMAVIKADAYGHGAVQVAKTAVEAGAEFLGVARLNEAKTLRDAGITAPILLFGSILADQAEYAAANDIRISVGDVDMARALSHQAPSTPLKIHIKLDTGMGRLGLATGNPEDATEAALAIGRLPNLEVEGLYTHFANADTPSPGPTLDQFEAFMAVRSRLDQAGHLPPICHAANSAATLTLPQTHLDMVRPGISMYGLSHSPNISPEDDGLKRLMSIESKIIHLKKVDKGFPISYGSTYITPRATTIATIPIGYGDGYRRFNSNKGIMLAGGKRAPVVGRVCMDLTMIDTGEIPGLKPGDPVIIMGKQGDDHLWAEELADLSHTVNYEVVASLTRRMPIHYIKPQE